MRESYGSFILEQERKERKQRMIITGIVVIVLLIVAVIAVVLLKEKGVFQKVSGTVGTEQNEEVAAEDAVYYTQTELDAYVSEAATAAQAQILSGLRQHLEEGMTAVEAFRIIYPNDLVVASDGQYHFIPINQELKKNDYKAENLQILETGEYQYTENGQVVSYKGIDVSKFQGWVDWNAVAADGVSFAFIRVGNRGYGSGELVEDTSFHQNMKGANAAGIKTGVYFFSQAVTVEEGIEEANFVLQRIAPYQVDCPIVIDVEMVVGDEGRADTLSAEERTAVVKAFCDTVANAGYKPMIYLNLEVAALHLNMAELEAYDKWLAYYNTDFYYPYEYKVWQYNENGTVAGLRDVVDVNICFEPIWEQE